MNDDEPFSRPGRTAHLTPDNRPRHAGSICDICDALNTLQSRENNEPDWYKERYKGNDPAWLTKLVKQERDKLDEVKISAGNPRHARVLVMLQIPRDSHTYVRCRVDKARIAEQTGPGKPYLTISDFVTDAMERHCDRVENGR